MALNQEEVNRLKGLGFLRNRGTDDFSARIVPHGTVFTPEHLEAIAELARSYGNGKVAFTTRQCSEVVGIPYEKTEEVLAFAREHDLVIGGTGPRVRPVTACKGTTCVFGCYDTQALAAKVYETFYEGWAAVKLPHKFKIGLGGCPNSCIKPSLNDLGVEGRRNGKYQIYVGGTWGRNIRHGTPLSVLVSEEEILPIIEKTILWFRKNAYAKERLGIAIDRLGIEKFETDVLSSDALLQEKEQILAAELLKKDA